MLKVLVKLLLLLFILSRSLPDRPGGVEIHSESRPKIQVKYGYRVRQQWRAWEIQVKSFGL